MAAVAAGRQSRQSLLCIVGAPRRGPAPGQPRIPGGARRRDFSTGHPPSRQSPPAAAAVARRKLSPPRGPRTAPGRSGPAALDDWAKALRRRASEGSDHQGLSRLGKNHGPVARGRPGRPRIDPVHHLFTRAGSASARPFRQVRARPQALPGAHLCAAAATAPGVGRPVSVRSGGAPPVRARCCGIFQPDTRPLDQSACGTFDEMHAHLFGAALPAAAGRFPAVPNRRVPARQYRE